jgi:hypothetical protein
MITPFITPLTMIQLLPILTRKLSTQPLSFLMERQRTISTQERTRRILTLKTCRHSNHHRDTLYFTLLTTGRNFPQLHSPPTYS